MLHDERLRRRSDNGLTDARDRIDVFKYDLTSVGAHKRRHAFNNVPVRVYVLEVGDWLDQAGVYRGRSSGCELVHGKAVLRRLRVYETHT